MLREKLQHIDEKIRNYFAGPQLAFATAADSSFNQEYQKSDKSESYGLFAVAEKYYDDAKKKLGQELGLIPEEKKKKVKKKKSSTPGPFMDFVETLGNGIWFAEKSAFAGLFAPAAIPTVWRMYKENTGKRNIIAGISGIASTAAILGGAAYCVFVDGDLRDSIGKIIVLGSMGAYMALGNAVSYGYERIRRKKKSDNFSTPEQNLEWMANLLEMDKKELKKQIEKDNPNLFK